MAEADSSNLMLRMTNLEKQFMKIPSHHNLPESSLGSSRTDAENQKEAQVNRFANQRLYSPKLKQIIAKQDASGILKEEIGESFLRLKAAKFGHSIEEIAPQYDKSFYLPDKDKYRPPQTSSFRTRPMKLLNADPTI